MKGAAHTPGPWTYEYNPYVSQDDREMPAFQIHGEEKVCDTNEDRPCEEQEANARPIAAAPLLLETLCSIAGDDESCTCHTRSWYGSHHDTQCPIRVASDAIAEAKGGRA